MKRLAVLAVALAALSGCKQKETFPSLGDKVASPIDVAVADGGQYFYVLNADFDRTYDSGSILVMDKDGNKIKAVEVPRMGRSLTLAGSDLIVGLDYPDDKEDAKILLFDVSDPATPVQKADLAIDCSPMNAVAEKDYPYFFVTCTNGMLYQGEFGSPRENSTLKKVRSYGVERRALLLDTKRDLLLAFKTDLEKQATADREYLDQKTVDALIKEVKNGDASVPNEVPDVYEETKRAQSNKSQRQTYQFVVYDIAKEKAAAPGCTVSDEENCNFPYRSNSDPVVDSELRWIYFRLANFDGAPDPSPEAATPGIRYYRTNFFEAKKDPTDPDVFYLSHRGNPDKSPFANQIVRVTITGDLHVAADTMKAPHTSDVMSFERVYGFKGAQATKYVFPGDFEVQDIGGQKTMIINNFRDLINWVRSDTYFSLGAQVVDDTSWFAETNQNADGTVDLEKNSRPQDSFYQVAVNPEGRTFSCSFYGNAVLLLDVKPGIGISEPKRIE